MKVRYVSAKNYYRKALTDAFDNFENREITVSHTFREKHPFLQNRSYGEAFFHAVRQHGRVGKFHSVLEIGGGRGELARDFIRAWVKSTRAMPKMYKIIDLSSPLLKSQKQLLRRSPVALHFVQADAERFPFKNGSFNGLIIANEMIADLDSWEIVRKAGDKTEKDQIGALHCVGKECEQFSPQRVRKYLRRYKTSSLLRQHSMIFPFGLVLLLEELFRVINERSSVIMTEYFDLKGGGSVVRFYKHSESSLSLDLVCHLARKVGFSVRVVSLIDFLGLNITTPVLTRSLLAFTRDKLGYPVSVTSLYGTERLRNLMAIDGKTSYDGFLSRAQVLRFVSGFYVIVLKKRRKLSAADFHAQLVVKKEANIVKMRSRKGESYLVTSHPFTFRKLNQSGEQIWGRINGKNSIGNIAGYLARYWRISYRRAFDDTLNFIRTLYRRHYVG